MKTNGKHETSPAGLRQAKRDNLVASLFVTDRTPKAKEPQAEVAQTIAERQESLRARRAIEGMAEVRGIYLLRQQHAALKKMAKNLRSDLTKQAK